ncbi:MAG: AzlC family ABC transporter permease [Planctomycetes bacterium]|nr:AzlC family ABC transporter permease [Planctomycetota bacterium]
MDDRRTSMAPGGIAAAFRAALPLTLPVLTGYLFLGSAYGVLMHRLGYGVGWTAAMSVVVYGGTIQFLATGLLAAGFQPANAFLISTLVNARHLFYGFPMLTRFHGTGWKKPFLIFWLTDETFSLLCSGESPAGVDRSWFLFAVSGLNQLYWIAGGVLGNLAGATFAFDARGLDFVMTALFTVIVMNQWRTARCHSPALIGFGLSVVCLAAFGPAYFIIPAMVLIAGVLLLARRRLEPALGPDAGKDCR